MNPQAGPERPPTRPARTSNGTPRVELSEIIEAVDLVELVTRYAGPGRHSGGHWTFSCPHPDHPDTHPSFTVGRGSSGKWKWRCWSRCGTSGDALDLLVWLHGLSKVEARARLVAMSGRFSTPQTGPGFGLPYGYGDRTPKPITTRNPLDPATAENVLSKYLDWRRWPRETVDRFRLEVVKDPRGNYRVRHPFLRPERDGSLSVPYWQDRKRSKDPGPKWLSPTNGRPIPHNLPSLNSPDVRAVLLTEGPADAISASVALDGNGSVAVLGIPGAQLWRADWARAFDGLPVGIWKDSDDAGSGLADKVREVISELRVISTDHPDLTDTLGALGPEFVRERILSEFDLEPSTPVQTFEEWFSDALEVFPGSTVYIEAEVDRER